MEGRQLLSVYTGFSSVRPIVTKSAVYQIAVTGGGFVETRAEAPGIVDIKLVGSTPSSTLSVNLVRSRGHFTNGVLGIGRLVVRSGQLGAIQALNTADLLGPVSPLNNAVQTIQLDAIGPNANLDVQGSLGSLQVARGILLGPNGSIHVAGNLAGPLQVGGPVILNGGSITVGNDVTGPVNIAGDLNVNSNGVFSVGRDLANGIVVGGNLILDSGGNLTVGRTLGSLTVNGDVTVKPTGGAISVGGDMNGLTVNGAFQGKGNSNADLNVGLNLHNLTVLGGGANQGGLQKANINVGKQIVGLNVPHGIFDSLITAGVLIDGGTQSGGNVGADGTDAVLDSQIRAGFQIRNIVFSGDVVSDYPTNPNPGGYPTRIVAGEDRAGNFITGGNIENFQITGALIDAVIAASVKPNGGNGTLPTGGYNAPPLSNNTPGDGGFNTYDKPFGTVAVGTFVSSVAVPNYTELSYYNETLTGVNYDPIDPTIDDAIFPGAINRTFASQPAINSAITVTNGSSSSSSSSQTVQTVPAKLAIPKQSTVLGGVVSTPHGDQFDYAGIFAADTSGVFVGTLPTQ
jgi:hypothetical protein